MTKLYRLEQISQIGYDILFMQIVFIFQTMHTQCFCHPIHGIHVHVKIRNQFVKSQLCFTACNGGKYGKDCLQECSANCLTPPCDHITGECSNGCNDGWLGSNCTQSLFLFSIDVHSFKLSLILSKSKICIIVIKKNKDIKHSI